MSEQSKSEDQGVDSLDFDKRNVLYIIKGGKVRVLQLEMAVPNGMKYPRSATEMELLASLTGKLYTEEEAMQKYEDENAYEILIDSGFYAIKVTKEFDGKEKMNIFAPETTSLEDANLLLKMYTRIVNSGEINELAFHNRVTDKTGKAFEKISNIITPNSKEKVASEFGNKIKLFLEDKIEEIRDSESFKTNKEMFERYRKFDLANILYGNSRKDPINIGDAGVIVITPEEVIASNCKKGQHIDQINEIIRNKYYNNYDEPFQLGDLLEKGEKRVPNKYESIMIMLLNVGEPYVITHLPTIMNEFQHSKISSFAQMLSDMEKSNGGSKELSSYIISNGDDEKAFTHANELLEYVNGIKEINNGMAKLSQSSPVILGHITEGRVDDMISQINMNRANGEKKAPATLSEVTLGR